MFAYCNNNPIMCIDTSGEFPWFAVIGVVVFAIVGGVLGYTYDGRLGVQSSEQQNSINTNPLPPNQSNRPQSDGNSKIDSFPQDSESELTAGDRLRNTFVGAGLGLAIGGAVVATGGAVGAVVVGSATAYIGFFGGTALQTIAIGALAYDIFAIVIAPFFGLEMETIELEP